MKHRRSFTLVELLIVISIISILLSIITMNYFRLRNEAKTAKVGGDLHVVRIAVEDYAARTGSFPATLGDVLKVSGVINILPTDAFNPSDIFKYQLSPDKDCFAVWSFGPDGKSLEVLTWDGKKPNPCDEDDIGITNGTPPNDNWK